MSCLSREVAGKAPWAIRWYITSNVPQYDGNTECAEYIVHTPFLLHMKYQNNRDQICQHK